MHSLLRWLSRLLTSPSSKKASRIAPPHVAEVVSRSVPTRPAIGPAPVRPPSVEQIPDTQTFEKTAPASSTTSTFYEHHEAAIAQSRFTIPKAPAASTSMRWLPAGESLRVQDQVITHGMIYSGADTNSSEPSLINPRLRASRGTPAPLGYWPSYSGMEPTARYQYLDWLASGARSPIDIGYVFVFFYGLERRLLIDGGMTNGEAPLLLAEIERLLALYDSNRSFKNYASSLIEFCRNSQRGDTDSLKPEHCTATNGYEVPFSLRLKLGVVARDGSPLAAEWAHCWSIADPLLSRRTPVSRCPEEFKTAFVHSYTAAFGEGLILPRNKTTLKAGYQPASAGLRGAKIELSCDLPDVLATTVPRKKLQEVVDSATELIETYSRCLSRNQDKRGHIQTVINLPVALWPERLLGVLHKLHEEAAHFPTFTCASLLARLGYEELASPAFLATIWKVFEDFGLGLEPDVCNGARRPKPEEPVVLFQLKSAVPITRVSATYSELSIEVSLAACLALVDGHACERELAQIEQMIEASKRLPLDLQSRLRAQYRLQIAKPSPVAALRSKLQTAPESMRLAVVSRLSSLASSDGVVSPEEVRFLENLYKALQLNPQLVYAHLYSDGASGIATTKTTEQRGQESTTASMSLDLAKISKLQAETAQVSALLAGVFTEAETEPVAPEGPSDVARADEAESHEPSLLPGLDSAHNQFLLLLLTRAQWTRGELQDAATDIQLMLDGALERINEAALDTIGEALLDGEDPVFVDQTLMETATA